MSKTIGRIIEWIIVVVIFVILGFIAIPLYDERQTLIRNDEVHATVKLVQDRIVHYRATHGRLPNSDAELGQATVLPRRLIQSLTVGNAGVVTITLSGGFSKLDGKTVVLVPEIKGRQITWRCGEGTLRNYLWAYCPKDTENTGGQAK